MIAGREDLPRAGEAQRLPFMLGETSPGRIRCERHGHRGAGFSAPNSSIHAMATHGRLAGHPADKLTYEGRARTCTRDGAPGTSSSTTTSERSRQRSDGERSSGGALSGRTTWTDHQAAGAFIRNGSGQGTFVLWRRAAPHGCAAYPDIDRRGLQAAVHTGSSVETDERSRGTPSRASRADRRPKAWATYRCRC